MLATTEKHLNIYVDNTDRASHQAAQGALCHLSWSWTCPSRSKGRPDSSLLGETSPKTCTENLILNTIAATAANHFPTINAFINIIYLLFNRTRGTEKKKRNDNKNAKNVVNQVHEYFKVLA